MATETQAPIEEIEPFEAAEEIEDGVVLIDTREPHEYQEAHLEGGKLVPPGLLADEIEAAAPDKSARTILYCRSGNRWATRTSPRWRAASSPGRSRGCRSSPRRG
jgi:sulfur-carrier protein adenylyltransferase/sulfurtransferase